MISIIKDQPQLIVGYDSQNETADLIHVLKAQPGKDYYCPCCGGAIRPRAQESELVQAHFYHLDGSCSKESQIHWMYKHYLFEENSQFYVGDELYTVQSIEIEKVWKTSVGDYRPDITVHTTDGNTLFFEMFFTSSKDDEYLYKWQELDCDVIEVDIKKLLNLTEITIPRFEYLYHDGILYAKEYHPGSLYASTIGARKEAIRREDYQKYKEHWAKLDGFYQLLKGVVQDEVTEDELFDNFSSMHLDDMYPCYEIIKKTNCVKHYRENFKELINKKVIDELTKIITTGSLYQGNEKLVCISPYRYKISFNNELVNDYISFSYDGDIIFKFKSSLKSLEHIKEAIEEYNALCSVWEKKRKVFESSENKMKNIESKYDLHFKIKDNCIDYKAYQPIYDRYIQIASKKIDFNSITDINDIINIISNGYEELDIKEIIRKSNADYLISQWAKNHFRSLENEWWEYIYDSSYDATFTPIIAPHIFIKLSKEKDFDAYVAIYIGTEKLYEKNIVLSDIDTFDFDELYEIGRLGIDKVYQEVKDFGYYINKINNCKNGCWKATLARTNDIYKNRYNICIKLYNTETLCERQSYRKIKYSDHICDDIYDAMKGIIKDKEFYGIGICSEGEVRANELRWEK